ncbi:MAG TPA: nucleoside triphosphate pyrophosphohydrolase [Anaerolineae bacterium]|nr:nucleoside triphosphate pyrophosphohydrolase [Anaerolineae bacterium]HPL29152.1 nucleoside triphosphate pyrophosphohydrolase [Anaerolineae bacterium]
MPQQIIIVGLGPGDPRHLTVEATQVFAEAGEVYLRTRRHPVAEALPGRPTVHSFDDLYESAASFEELYRTIAAQLLELGARPQGVVYAVPGHPLVAERTVGLILSGALERGLPVRLVDGLSFVEPILSALRIDALGLQISDALDLAQQHSPLLDPDRPALVAQLYSRQVASDVKLTLLNIYPPEHLVTVVLRAGLPTQELRPLPLEDLDREDVDHLTSLYLPPLPQPGSLISFQELIAHLRSPMGCPWDREQTHQSLRPHLLEETYEVLAALDLDDMDELKEELGDLLLQIVLHAQIATECSEFTMPEVVGQIMQKLRRRHPHVFGEVTVEGTGEILRNWEEIKRAEKGTRRVSSTFEGVSSALPALARAQAIGSRAARIGFDWPDSDAIWRQLEGDSAALRAAQDPEVQAHELGDLLFTLVSLARWLKVDAESALREATARFMARVVAVEDEAVAAGRQPQELTPDELHQLWQRAKARSRA